MNPQYYIVEIQGYPGVWTEEQIRQMSYQERQGIKIYRLPPLDQLTEVVTEFKITEMYKPLGRGR